MANIEIKTATTKNELLEFIRFRNRLYKDSPTDVPYLEMAEMDTLRRDKNPAFKFCEAEYYMAYRDGKAVGRIAAIINKKANEQWNINSVRFGFFDFIDDFEVSSALINKVMEYGRKHGNDSIIGPLGFTDMDREGLQVSGFDHMASMHANHNYSYYKDHMDKFGGFEKDNDWVQLYIPMPDENPEKYVKVAAMVEKRYNLHAKKLTMNQIKNEGYGRKIFDILNICYKDLYNYSQLDDEQIEDILKNYLGLADLNLITVVVDGNKNDELVGFGISFPSFSKALRATKNGRLFPFGWYHLLKALKFHDTKTVDLMLVGVLPEYRAKGANSIIFIDLINWYRKYGFEEALCLPMMETNNGVLDQWKYFDAKEVIRLRSYRRTLS